MWQAARMPQVELIERVSSTVSEALDERRELIEQLVRQQVADAIDQFVRDLVDAELATRAPNGAHDASDTIHNDLKPQNYAAVDEREIRHDDAVDQREIRHEERQPAEPPTEIPAGVTAESAVALKRCATCGEVKPLDEFDRDASRADGHRSRCRSCRSHHDRRRRSNGVRPAEAAQPAPFPVA
jgi:hypothetical protein